MDAVTLLGKYFIYISKLKVNAPTWPEFQKRLKYELEIEKEIAKNVNKVERYIDKWGQFWIALEHINYMPDYHEYLMYCVTQ